MSNKLLRVEGNSYFSDFKAIDDDLLLFHRSHYRRSDSNEIDVFGQMWSLGIADLSPNQVSVKRNGEVVTRSGLWAAFIPPFNIVDWHIKAGLIEWKAYLSSRELPIDIPQKAFAFPLKKHVNINNFNDLVEVIRGRDSTLFIDKQEHPKDLALHIKLLIEENYQDEMSIVELAKQCNVSHSFMTRIFKQSFGVTPKAYKNKLRISESVRLMLTKNFNVTRAGYKVGFNDSSRFSKQFFTYMNAVPSEFCLQKKIRD
ncbi:MAG: helix-turn-helix transcriptional regulator [Bdellovibrionales bacterium]|nr:helix-turn-helix transcriptional regulator [Bdellovibrionales bacterium]